jgi:hypothetical protein
MPTYIQTIKNQGIFPTTGSITILNGASLSNAIALDNRTVVAIILPSAWTAASITFQASVDGTNYFNVYTQTTELSATVGASYFVVLPRTTGLESARYIKIRSGTSATPVNQSADRVISVISVLI